ncbi:hypothetical protein AVEN_157551-2 [Araneus ventricosus]|uniref:RNase H type-1 domain-containing protein n=1 Tax=Araneus ventricosus TaxID=182803 RepID=A0A4Y2KG26_ARAVE|nr:hypothetical protein AVEN_157551-2 [Araneus ventricosus]
MDLSGEQGFCFRLRDWRSSWVMKLESAAGSPSPTRTDFCSHAGWVCFATAHYVKQQEGVFGFPYPISGAELASIGFAAGWALEHNQLVSIHTDNQSSIDVNNRNC